MGRAAQQVEWSCDDKYVAYLWAAYDTMGGSDLWIYDVANGRSRQLTSLDVFSAFDAEAEKAKARYAREKSDEEARLKLADKEYREAVQKLRKENESRREPLPSYPGVSSYEWSHKGHSMLLVYRGDIYRLDVGQERPVRLTKTKESESNVEWLPDDDGFTFQRGSVVYRMQFGSHLVEQLNPDLPAGVNFSGYTISPDGNRMVIFGSKQAAEPRMVDYITYRGRFAEAKKTPRGVAEDDFTGESTMYVFSIAENVRGDGKPTEVWKWNGGEEFQEISLSNHPWSKDSTKLTFGSWKRDKKELIIHVVDVAGKKVTDAFKTTSDGEHRTPSLADPMFMPDGKRIVVLLDLTGFRHPHMLDLATGGVTPITQGNYECYPEEISDDGKWLWVEATKEHPSRNDVYRVNLATSEMERFTHGVGNYGSSAPSHDSNRVAAMFRSWEQLNELFVADGRGQKQVTKSHDSIGFFGNIKLKPQLFEYKNRHGHTVHGYAILPPGFQKTDKRPLMVYVYGGPLGVGKSVNVGDFNSTAYLFNMYLSYVLGYVTVTIDPRGQSGYGSVFGKANWNAPGVAQVEDLSDGVKHLIENYAVDPAKVAINGWSFGGFQTQMCLYTAPDVFTLGIAGAGPTEWQNYNTWYVGGVIGNAPKGNPEPIDKFSLTHMAKNLRSPLLLLHGVEDTNVLFQDTIKVYRELLVAGKGPLVELSIDPTGGHGMGGDMNNRDRHAIYLAFVLKHWGRPSLR